ncbi:MAG: EAL domain-containing protein, partial [Sphingopyxis sp.]|nr:EAL domain-containing protein [Sphingopyxis sp.]
MFLWRFRRAFGRFEPTAHLLAIAAAVLFLMVAAMVSLTRAADTVDAIDLHRTQLSVANSINREVDGLRSVAADNGLWDAAALAFASRPKLEQFLDETYRESVSLGEDYDHVLAINRDGLLISGIDGQGLMRTDRGIDWLDDVQRMIGANLAGQDSVAGIVATADGLRIIAISRARMFADTADTQHPGTARNFLVFARRVTNQDIQSWGRHLLVQDASLRRARSEAKVILRDPQGQEIAWVGWTALQPGQFASQQVLPMLALTALFVIVALALTFRVGIRSIAELHETSMIDPVSGINNRRAALQLISAGIERGHGVALAFIDLDRFKAINDQHGHSVGDAVIRHVAGVVSQAKPPRGFVARIGGDEFAIVAQGHNADTLLGSACAQVLETLQQSFAIGDCAMFVGASIGLSSTSTGADDSSELMRRADIAMYNAKAEGKMRLKWYDDDMDHALKRAMHIEEQLTVAVDNNALSLHYQPIMEAKGGAIAGVECLLRWDHDGRPISPDVFIPVAEETGLINRLGLFVLREACTTAQRWGAIKLSANISAVQLRNPDFPKDLARILKETGYPPRRLEMEITESRIDSDPSRAGRVLNAISAMGVALALDDFGTGYASIG